MTSLPSLFLNLPYSIYHRASKTLIHRASKKCLSPYKGGLGEKKLLYVAASCLPYHVSGYTSRTHEVLEALKKQDCQVQAITRPGYPWDRKDRLASPIGEQYELDSIPYDHLKKPSGLKPLAAYALLGAKVIEKYIIKNNINCVHAASNHVNALPALIAARRLGLPFQYEMRGLWELTRASRFPSFRASPAFNFGLEMEAFVARNSDKLFVISRQLGLYAMREWNIEESRIRLLPNCVDVERIKPMPEIMVIPDLIGYAGSIMNYEGLDILLEAIAYLNSQNRRVKLMIIGDGEARPALEKLSSDLGLQELVSFAGRLDPESARKKLASASLVCIPRKDFEVCRIITPLKLVEAMALGKAVICPELPVFMDELGELSQGWTFKAGDAKDLAEKIAQKLGQNELLTRQGESLRRHIINKSQWKQYIPALME